jgi:hypothetical protein
MSVSTAFADCYVDYKAKKNSDGLRLHYGVMQVSDELCHDKRGLEKEVSSRLAVGGWTVLRINPSIDQSGLNSRKEDAGVYFLRY